MIKPMHFVCFLLLSLSAAFVYGEQPATAPSADEAAILQTFRDYNDAMMKGDEPTMIALQHAQTDAQKTFQTAIAKNDLAVGKLKGAVMAKFGEDAARQVARSLGDVSNDDLARAKVRINGNRAVIGIDGGGIPMIKVGEKWLFDMTDPAIGADAERAAQQLSMYESRAKNCTDVAEAVNDGKFSKVEEIIEELKSDGL